MAKERVKYRAQPLAELVNRALDPLVAKRGFGETTLLTQWETIAGPRLAAISEPERLKWPPRAKNAPADAQTSATLSLRVEPGFGLDVQHLSGALVERINAHLGWRCVAKIVLRQETLGRTRKKKRSLPTPSPEAKRRAAETVGGVDNPKLREALIKLGELCLSRK
jgi:hypothetical protein